MFFYTKILHFVPQERFELSLPDSKSGSSANWDIAANFLILKLLLVILK
jgi:hypothetical protein